MSLCVNVQSCFLQDFFLFMIQTFSLTLPKKKCVEQGISVSIYRGDLEHPAAPGNKWHKLKYNIDYAKKLGLTHVISFGGPYSNHLHALANISHSVSLQAVAIVRGELHPTLTPTLRDFVQQGGILWPSQRRDYTLGIESDLAKQITAFYPNAYWVPEGGSNALGIAGCYDWAEQILQQETVPQQQFDTWVLSAGTGATCAGFLAHPHSPELLVFPALKKGENLLPTINAFALKQNTNSQLDKLSIIADYHHGGYAKFPVELQEYVKQIHQLNPNVKLDPVYTAKVVYGLEQEIRKGRLKNKKLLIIHTGGLQGWSGFNQY